MMEPPHPLNWRFGWWLLLAAFLTGAAVGLFFHDEAFLGGYASFRRRLLRLGHIALAALGILNVVFGLSPCPLPGTTGAAVASLCFIVGGLGMPAVCFLTAWRTGFRYLFVVPVVSLVLAVLFTVL